MGGGGGGGCHGEGLYMRTKRPNTKEQNKPSQESGDIMYTKEE